LTVVSAVIFLIYAYLQAANFLTQDRDLYASVIAPGDFTGHDLKLSSMGIVIGVFLSTFHHEYEPILKNLYELQKYITVQSLQVNIEKSA
jgi:hypothetical protein